MLLIVGANSLLWLLGSKLSRLGGPMRTMTSIGSSPTGRCSGLDKVPWRDLTLLDKLDIQAWGFITHRMAMPHVFYDATINRRLLFPSSPFHRSFAHSSGAWGHGWWQWKGRDLSWYSKYVYVDFKAVQDHLRSGISRICIMWSVQACLDAKSSLLTLCTRPSDVECRPLPEACPACMIRSHATITILTTRNPPTQLN